MIKVAITGVSMARAGHMLATNVVDTVMYCEAEKSFVVGARIENPADVAKVLFLATATASEYENYVKSARAVNLGADFELTAALTWLRSKLQRTV